MNLIETLLVLVVIVILFCLAPILIFPALALVVGGVVLWVLMQVSVLLFQGALALAGMAIKKGEEYRKNRSIKLKESLCQNSDNLIDDIKENSIIEEPKP